MAMQPLLLSAHHIHCPLEHGQSQVENEDLVFTLEAIVEKFGEEIGPYAVELARNLTVAFWKYSNAADDEDDDETCE